MAVPALLYIEGEEPLHGISAGFDGMAAGVMASSTLAAGFTDLISDPFYTGRIVCFTYPHVGNAGVAPGDLQSDRVAARAVVAREICKIPANRLGERPLTEFLTANRIPAIEDVDTRTVAAIVTRRGMVKAAVGCGEYADANGLAKALADGGADRDVTQAGVTEAVSCGSAAEGRPVVAVIDCGVKKGFVRRLTEAGYAVRLLPATAGADAVLGLKPKGVIISSGPGAPGERPETVAAAKALLGAVPLWGVGIGGGIVAEAAGAMVVVNGKGHAGGQPVGRTGEPSGEMTMQCHDFWIEGESLPAAQLAPTHHNLNDGTLEGFACATRRIMGTLFHPEAEPGPRDSLYLFARFHEMMLS